MTQATIQQDSVQPEATQPAKKPFFSFGTLTLIAGILIFGTVIGFALMNQNQVQPIGGPAPNFTLTTFDDQTFQLSDLRGKVVFINFWASWCAPCESEAADLQRAWEYYEGRDDVVFIGIAYADNGPRSLEFMERHGITYLNGPDRGTVISHDYNIQGVPESFVIDQEGNIAQFIYSTVTDEQLISIVDGLLAVGQ